MPWGLHRFQETGQLHFLTFSCYKRRPNFANAPSRTAFETSLERVRQRYGLCVYGYVVMPEHIHMLVNEPEQGSLSQVMQSLKQSVARTLALRAADPFWQARYYDVNVWSEHKFVEKLRYIHRNPVTRGLVESVSQPRGPQKCGPHHSSSREAATQESPARKCRVTEVEQSRVPEGRHSSCLPV